MERLTNFVSRRFLYKDRFNPEALYLSIGIKIACLNYMGYRETMQDVSAIDFNNGTILASVFDGHGKRGKKIAGFASKYLHKTCLAELGKNQSPLEALSSGYASTQNFIKSKKKFPESGTTAVTACIKNGELYVANVGDSRAVLVKKNEVTMLSQDHIWDGYRKNEGELNITKSLGDVGYSIRTLSHEPFTKSVELKDDAIYLLLLSDGFPIELLNKRYLIDTICIYAESDPKNVCEKLFKLAKDSKYYDDNISIIAVNLQTIPAPDGSGCRRDP